jgi:glycosyltransferase involved in cell wall biosynthesis
MKHLGIFLGYSPGQLDPHQGISRLVTFIVKGALKSDGLIVTIAGPGWLRSDIENLLDDAGIPPGMVRIITTPGEPYILKLRRLFGRFRRKPTTRRAKLINVERIFTGALEKIVDWLGGSSLVAFISGLLVVALAIALLSVPVLIGTLMASALFLARFLVRRANSGRIGFLAGRLLDSVKRSVMSVDPVDRIRKLEFQRLVALLNRSSEITVWYVPSMFWPEVSNLKGRVVMAAPDIVLYEYPAQFSYDGDNRILNRVTSSLEAADHVICYSEYIKQKHLIEANGIPEGRISVIRHGIVDLSDTRAGKAGREEALRTLHEYILQNEQRLPSYLKGFRFDDVSFLFYSSQVRPYKNIEGLIRVYERLLREHYRPVKLILTGNLAVSERIIRYLKDKELERDVISLYAIPNEVLAAVYKLATLSITPTQFEGGFPFTFSEAYSVGTPSLMSRIPVVREVIKDSLLLDRMTFDPADRNEMLRKILWGLDNRDELYRAQAPLFEELSTRTWRAAADDYLRVIKTVARGKTMDEPGNEGLGRIKRHGRSF